MGRREDGGAAQNVIGTPGVVDDDSDEWGEDEDLGEGGQACDAVSHHVGQK